MTLVLPVLLIMLLGLVELGFLMHAHLIIVNANREAARFASRGTFTNEEIAERAVTTVSNSLPLVLEIGGEPELNTVVLITHIVIPGDDKAPLPKPTVYRYPEAEEDEPEGQGMWDAVSQIKPDVYQKKLQDESIVIFPEDPKDKKNTNPVAQEVVYVEMFYKHEEVLGAPFVDWIFPDKMMVYSHTVMRVLPPR
jgi:hypothetical protein